MLLTSPPKSTCQGEAVIHDYERTKIEKQNNSPQETKKTEGPLPR